MNGLRVSDPLFVTPLESVVRRFLSSSLFDSELVTLRMPVDILERDGMYAVKADLPGLKKDDINVRIEGNQVQIEVRESPDTAAPTNGDKVLRQERNHAAISRTFSMADDIDDTQVKASYVDGVLQLELPKKASSAARKIAIQ
ncbi:heat-shock protein Hsp20 [Rhodoferax lacus]|uniref:Heat-shock protein Hsp20 n=1 Tax=Rhodoferax lacus TaxID=2184758 RepID=A0A3E1R9Z0_9BURK|nr:Hsp20/alpha crystallin family protein [Rhodoferax lacus]RFO96041.1 heat-shock protein Hsp20 [Rhodoferax lacus]